MSLWGANLKAITPHYCASRKRDALCMYIHMYIRRTRIGLKYKENVERRIEREHLLSLYVDVTQTSD